MTRVINTQDIDRVMVGLSFNHMEKRSVKAALAVKLSELIKKRSVSSAEAAASMSIIRPQVRNDKSLNISPERLMQILVPLGQHI